MTPPTSLPAVAALLPGEHVCCLYDTEEEHRALLTPFLRQGLERGEKVLYIADAHTAETVLDYLRQDGFGVDPFLSNGQLRILSTEDSYTRDGTFDPERMIALLAAETEQALAQGYTALRVTGEMSWALRGWPGADRLIEYEARLNLFSPGSKCLAVCQYDRRRFDPSALLDVLRTHPVVVVGTEAYENFYYMPPHDLLGPDPAAATLQSWLESLRSRKLTEQALRDAHDTMDKRVDERTKDLLEANERLRLEIERRLQAEKETYQRRRQAEGLARVARMVTASLELPEVLNRVARAVIDLFPDSSSRIWVADGDRLILRSESGTPARLRAGHRTELALGEGLAGHVAVTREPLVVEDALADPRTVNVDWLREAGYVSYVGVPLLVRDRLVGVLAILAPSRRRFSPQELETLVSFGAQAAIAIENARLLEESKAYQSRLEGLLTVSRQLSRIQPLESLLGGIAEACGRLLGAESAGFRLREEDDLVVTATWGDAGQIMLVPRVKVGESLSGRVAATGEPLLVHDPANDPRLLPAHREAMSRLGYRAWLGIPVKIGEEVAGLLNIHTRRPEGFPKEDMAIATAFASQAAVALENSNLYRELRQAFDELARAQDHLLQGEKLRVLGQMASGVAHDFNNTLAVILGRAQLMLGQTRDPALQRQLKVVEKAAKDGAQTVRRIQEFARRKPVHQVEPVDLNQVAEDVIEVTRIRWKDEAQAKGILYDIRMEPAPLPRVNGVPSELREALTNLVFNAVEAMPQGGRLTVQTGVEDGRVFCRVSDTGIGMTEETKRRVFEPFFTTKVEKGSGLGLSVTFGIIARHHGEIEVQSEAGRGSAFTIWLPIGTPIEKKPARATPSRDVPPARILIIDDEPGVREILADVLTGLGHTVATCADGSSGFARFQKERFDLVITDLSMPGMSGLELARKIKAKRPKTPVILITGWGDRADTQGARANEADWLLTKPFDLDTVRGALRAVLTWRPRRLRRSAERLPRGVTAAHRHPPGRRKRPARGTSR